MMKGRLVLTWLLIVGIAAAPAYSQYYSDSVPHEPQDEIVTHLHFFFHNILTGDNPTAVMVAHANLKGVDNNPTPFGSVFVVDNPLTVGPEPTSMVIGNARGLSVSSSRGEDLVFVFYLDFGFTIGEFNGSSISVFSRDPGTYVVELAVVGGREKFRMARGFALLKIVYWNTTTGNAVAECDVTVIRYSEKSKVAITSIV